MEYVLDAFASEYIDKYTINECGVPGILLMEHAAEAVAEKIMERHDSGKKVLCVAGKGNNGGDAAAVCRLLREHGYDASCLLVLSQTESKRQKAECSSCAEETVFDAEEKSPDTEEKFPDTKEKVCCPTEKTVVLGDNREKDRKILKQLESRISADLYTQLKALAGLGGCCKIIGISAVCQPEDMNPEEAAVQESADAWFDLLGEKPDVVVDGLFGTGLSKAPRGIYRTAVEFVNLCGGAGAEIYSVDIPSGVDASTGRVPGACVHADFTITFGYRKIGQLLYPGRECCGRLSVHKIGFCESAVESLKASEHTAVTLSPGEIPEYMPGRSADSNKGSYGRVLMLAGSDNMPGACVLTAKTALRSGCGLVTVCSSEKVQSVIASAVPEVILLRDEEMPDLTGFTACLIGPGLGKTKESIRKTEHFLKQKNAAAGMKGIVFDADAINILADKMNALGLSDKEARLAYIEEQVPLHTVFTPHKKELSRLLHIPMEELANLTELAKWLSARSDRVFVLKDAATLVTGRGRLYINTTGNNGMSTAGSGDVLGGIIVSLLAQGSEPFTAACVGVCLHGQAGDDVKDIFSEYGVMAGDISDRAARLLRKYIKK